MTLLIAIVNTRPSFRHHAPLIRSRHMALQKCVNEEREIKFMHKPLELLPPDVMMKTKMHKIRFWLRLRCRPRSGCLPLAIYQTPKVDLRDPISKGRERIRRERKGRKRKGKWEWGGRMGRRNWGVKEGGKFASLALGGWTPYVTPHSGGVLLSIQNADNYTKKTRSWRTKTDKPRRTKRTTILTYPLLLCQHATTSCEVDPDFGSIESLQRP